MADDVDITLWLDRRWKEAIEKHLKDETLTEHLENVVDRLCDQLPRREYERISREIYEEKRLAQEAEEAARTWSAYRVAENGEEWYFKVTPGEELLSAAQKLRDYLKADGGANRKFIRSYLCGVPISQEEYRQMISTRMENTGKVVGVFDLDFDKREVSAINTMDGWRTWPMKDVSVAAYHAGRAQAVSEDTRWSRLLEYLEGRDITSAGHLSMRNFTFGDEIIELDDGRLNFYVQTEFDVDAAFGTHVLTDENDDWLNVYANYDMERGQVCDELELTLCKGDGSEENFTYPLNAAEKDVLRRRMEDFCMEQTGMSLGEYSGQCMEQQMRPPRMKL